jgi:hypothetical protein
LKLYKIITAILYIVSIITMSIFIIWEFSYFNLIGFVFLLLASVNMLIMQILIKKRNLTAF